MGYTTDFCGQFEVSPPMKKEHKDYLNEFNGTRRMARDAAKAEKMSDPIRIAAGLPIGQRGEYFVGNGENNPDRPEGNRMDSFAGQQHDESILDYNLPPANQPGLWCQWHVSEEGSIEWDGGEKFYYYVDWLEYLIKHFLEPWGYKINGEVTWEGEESDDLGKIVVEDNNVTTLRGTVYYE